MAVGGLQAVRDALTFAYAENVIDDVEFALLYDYNRSKPIFPYWKYEEFDVETWDDVECRTELRFDKDYLQSLIRCLQIPERIVCQQGTVCSGMEGLCILLRKLAYPCRYTCRYGTSVCTKSVGAASHFQQSYGHRLRDSPSSY